MIGRGPFAAVALLALVAPAAGAAEDGARHRRPVEEMLIDLPAQDFRAPDLGGATLSLADFRGQVVILNFWGIWCAPCRVEIPELVGLHRDLQPQGLEILAVNAGDDRRDVPPFVEKHGITFPVVFDEGVTDLYEVVAFPTSFVIDRAGRIRYVSAGYDPGTVGNLRRVVEHLLRQPPPRGD
jgi:peroxiredoxin